VCEFLKTGAWPKDQIDHIDGNKLDNRFENLRECNNAQNQANRRPDKNKTFKGVSPRPKGKFLARLGQKCLGTYTTPEDAARAYDKALVAKFGVFARTNFPTQKDQAHG
jgi:hypothetical protein